MNFNTYKSNLKLKIHFKNLKKNKKNRCCTD